MASNLSNILSPELAAKLRKKMMLDATCLPAGRFRFSLSAYRQAGFAIFIVPIVVKKKNNQ
jgi:hypothetical protein